MRKATLAKVVLLLICTLALLTSFAQSRKISGTVMGDQGTPLAGATVSVKDSELAVATNANGTFSVYEVNNVIFVNNSNE